MIFVVMVFGGLAVMLGGHLVMFGGFAMMIGDCRLGHGDPPRRGHRVRGERVETGHDNPVPVR